MDKNHDSELAAVRTALAEAIKTPGGGRQVQRLNCVLLVLLGQDSGVVAGWYGMDRTTVARWVRAFREAGAPGLRDGPRSGRPAKLAPIHWQALEDAVRQPPGHSGLTGGRWNGVQVEEFLKRRYGFRLSLRQCQRLLSRVKTTAPRSGAGLK